MSYQQYGAHQQSYGANQPSYGANQPPYGANQQAYGASQQSYGAKPLMDPYAAAIGAPQAPDYSYASAPTSYVAPPVPSAASTQFEYGGGQKLNPLMSPANVPAPYYGSNTPSAVAVGGAQITSNTNSKDPKSVKCRVFVGSLNTNIVNRDQVHQIYSPFGEIVAISMHKGYAFVQYAYETEARNAVVFTDGTLLGGKRIDVTISSEPKTASSDDSFVGNKRPSNVTTNTNFGIQQPKKPRLSAPASVPFKKPVSFSSLVAKANIGIPTSTTNGSGVGAALKHGNGEDIMICGRCRQLFPTVTAFSSHKPKCTAPPVMVKQEKVADGKSEATHADIVKGKPAGEPEKIQCFICHTAFDFSWHLLQHMSEKHSMTVYEPACDNKESKVKEEKAK